MAQIHLLIINRTGLQAAMVKDRAKPRFAPSGTHTSVQLLRAGQLERLQNGEATMNKLTAVAAATVISTLAATPVFAQADVLNGGAPTPAAKLSLEPWIANYNLRRPHDGDYAHRA